MAELYGRTLTREEILRRVGDVGQVAGVREVEFQRGRERGVRALQFRTGGGLHFTVLPDRGMDLGPAEWRGTPLCWISPNGFAGPWFHEPSGQGWLQTFGGGLLSTCGLSNVGPPSDDGDRHFGMHGRVSHVPAHETSVKAAWDGDEYVLEAEGAVREARVFGENLLMRRTIRTWLGSSRILIEDTVHNEGFQDAPLLVLYHINAGYPLVDESAELLTASSVEPRDADAAAAIRDYARGGAPTPDFREQVFRHHMRPDKDGAARVALVNPRLELGLAIRYRIAELPYFWQWRMLCEGTYVVGLEPANCHVMGRGTERSLGRLPFIEPGGHRRFSMEIEVVHGAADLEALRKEIVRQ